jgi:hypothetical protein
MTTAKFPPCKLAVAQGVFMVATGLWPLLSYRTFELASGPKKEPWLVKTVGLLLASWGLVLIRERRRERASLTTLGRTPALVLAGVDIWYAGVRRTISPAYLLDAAIELALVAAWSRRPRSAEVTQ